MALVRILTPPLSGVLNGTTDLATAGQVDFAWDYRQGHFDLPSKIL
ncbi:MAG: hypothetical protein RI572_11285 [Salegentibacter sp.]|nr:MULTISPECIES: hypothetical protein [Salegentibacter]MDR9457980.1 hypothetical protein [Salegentibacter sp.]